jgi:sensor histidine kinase YesM
MKPNFFPTNKTFWLLHGGVLFTLQSVMWVTTLLWGEQKLFNFVATLIWSLVFTEAVLFFRQHYQQKDGFSKSIFKRILLIIVYASIGGVVVATVTLVSVTPFFWREVVSSGFIERMQLTESQFLVRLAIQNTLQSQLFLAVWMFIYVSVTSGRRIKETELMNLRLQNSLKEAQLTNLSNQLNPHFLFNALNNIRFTIHRDPVKADAMLTGLSEMLRYSLESSRQDKVRLSEELEIVERYISLMKVQMGERLQFSMTVPNNLNTCFIPPMILQLLVENAVKHGIDKLRHGGSIELNGGVIDQQLVLSIRNACGKNKLLLGETSADNTGIGLVNIQSRLQLLYGDRASLAIEESDNCFCVTLKLPRETA